jgi:hypothetical protein
LANRGSSTTDIPEPTDLNASEKRLVLDLSSPASRGYASKSPRPRRIWDYNPIAIKLAWLGALSSLAFFAYLTVFTSPGRTENILAFVALVGFGSFFLAWAIGSHLRANDEKSASPPTKLTVTRQALLFAVGVVTLAVAAINQLVSPASFLLVVLVIVSAEVLLRRMRLHH